MHAACGPPSASTPVDENLEVAVVGGPLKLYDVVMHGVPTRMKLNEDDAKRYDATLVESEDSAPEAPGPESLDKTEEPSAKARSAPNKARQARDKATPGDG
jgi:hypothetical protein